SSACLAAPAAPPATPAPAADQPVLVFKTGFGGDTRVEPSSGTDDQLVGTDSAPGHKSDLAADLGLSEVSIQYTGGQLSQRHGKLVPDPANSKNQVLEFWLGEPWSASENQVKARVQANFYGFKTGYREFYQSVRVYLHPDLRALREYPSSIKWLTLAEFWNDRYWGGDPYGFRITAGIGKPSAAESDLNFILDAQGPGARPIWMAKNETIKVSLGKWFTLDTYFLEGDAATGRFYVAMTPDGGARKVVFDVTGWTRNPTDPAPGGMTDWNPLKLYTSKELVRFMQAKDRRLAVYWDDYELWTGRRPTDSQPAPPATVH
ncbi:MAG: hypothetical protein H7067_14360, partial [Burkholderiales bacterium]|nr:hypothetical protein [Opitutaceae bacterium]